MVGRRVQPGRVALRRRVAQPKMLWHLPPGGCDTRDEVWTARLLPPAGLKSVEDTSLARAGEAGAGSAAGAATWAGEPPSAKLANELAAPVWWLISARPRRCGEAGELENTDDLPRRVAASPLTAAARIGDRNTVESFRVAAATAVGRSLTWL